MTEHHPRKGIELYREDDTYVVLFDLPDHDPSDIEVRWRNGRLHVEAVEGTSGERHRVFHRSIGLSSPIEGHDISASYEDGVLTVTAPISDETPEDHQIDVEY
ncbi:Hsp20/alpha crystallin family protein [Haloarcula salina]|uniref:Hsp20/alpha crystallin family protein n=1 Tax=Haloarcula salina TaxID=1429914 RepID=A0AA41G4L9_9EURY|nr:Hsp20/alpha crystallin family protein [Haloarcula salina]MBV0903408.1 Hsp20/alpha crystallin family protein [Haloarcula salina]